MTASLYINAKGYPVTRHSYSGSSTFNHCARKYYLERVAGWKERSLEKSASMAFGRVMESCVTCYHAQGLNEAWAKFDTDWTKHRDMDLEYSEKQGNWEDLWCDGNELLRLYDIRYPSMPFEITGTENFQVEKSWEVFPNTDMAGIELRSYIDILAKLKPGRFEDANTDKVILDMKVSNAACPILVPLDPQLRTYSMVTKIPVCGFLWFQTVSRVLARGTEVVMLGSHGNVKGSKQTILSLDYKDIPTVPESIYMARNGSATLKEFEEITGQSKDAKAARLKFIENHGILVPVADITRQKIDVSLATISDDSREDVRRQIEQDIMRIVHASETDFWPMQGGVRYPNNKCVTCCMRGICAGNNELRDELLERSTELIF